MPKKMKSIEKMPADKKADAALAGKMKMAAGKKAAAKKARVDKLTKAGY